MMFRLFLLLSLALSSISHASSSLLTNETEPGEILSNIELSTASQNKELSAERILSLISASNNLLSSVVVLFSGAYYFRGAGKSPYLSGSKAWQHLRRILATVSAGTTALNFGLAVNKWTEDGQLSVQSIHMFTIFPLLPLAYGSALILDGHDKVASVMTLVSLASILGIEIMGDVAVFATR